jgi:hypothetical protein
MKLDLNLSFSSPASESHFYKWLQANGSDTRMNDVKRYLIEEHGFNQERGDSIKSSDLTNLRCTFTIWWDINRRPTRRLIG